MNLNSEKILIDLKVAEGISKKMNTSFLFSKDIKDIFEKFYRTDTDLMLILETLKRYWFWKYSNFHWKK